MSLADIDREALRQRIMRAYEADSPIFQEFRGYARRLRDAVKPLRTYTANAVAFVAADGGDNRIAFNPALIELVRVVDSRGNECALDAVGSTQQSEVLEERIDPASPLLVPPLRRLCNDLGMGVKDLSYLLRGLGDQATSTGAVRTYRDIVEWAVLYDLICNPDFQWGSDTIIIRDALLRTKQFKASVFPQIEQRIRDGIARHANRHVSISIVGVAKTSAVTSRLSLALELEQTLARDYPCFVKVPEDIEARCYNFDNTWLKTTETADTQPDGRQLYQSMGSLYLVKFGDRPLDAVWPVDVAVFQTPQAEKILGQLTVDAQFGFPIPDYPLSIQRAHDFANIGGLEMAELESLLMRGLCDNMSHEEVDRLLRVNQLSQNIAALRYKRG